MCLTDLGVVVCEELTDEFGVLIVDDKVLVSADGTGVAPTHFAVHDALPPGPGVTVSGISKVPTVELPDLAIAIPVFQQRTSLGNCQTYESKWFIYTINCRVFFARFQKTQGRLPKKLKPIFGKKTQHYMYMEATLGIKKKTRNVLTKTFGIYSKVLCQ